MGLGRLVRRGLCAALAGMAVLVAQAMGPAPEVRVLDRAEFTAKGEAEATAVTLPDTWVQRGRATQGEGRYRLVFDLDAVPEQPMAVRFTRVSSTRTVMLNGRIINMPHAAGRSQPMPQVFDLPTAWLKPGRNELDLDVQYRVRGGLSPATLGPASDLRETHDRDALWNRELPRTLNMGMTVLAVLMLTVWWRRRGERTIGLFGLLALLGSLRNYTYFADVALMPAPVADWFFYAAQVWSAALFCAFAFSLDPEGRAWRRWARWLAGASVVLPLLATGFAATTRLWVLRGLTYPLLLVLAVVAVALIWRAVRTQRDLTHVSLISAFLAVIGAGVHDYAFQQGHIALTSTFWMPFVMPVAFGLYGMMLMGRLVSAVAEVERLNVELEHRVQARTRALQNANLAKTRFLASASHDLRQPVAAIGLMVGLLRDQVPTPKLRDLVQRVDAAVESMESMLKGLLDLSRLESGTVHARVQWVGVQQMFDAIASHERDAAATKGLSLRFRPSPLGVMSDPVLLEQVVRNLVSNALRYTERGGVLVTARPRGGDVLFQVWDTGVGIAAEHQAAIFEEFVQVGGSSRGSRGLGLGLAIVQRSAAVLAHPLGLRSRLGRGSCFSVRVPRGHDERRARPRSAARAADQPLPGLRVLLIEDDAAVRHGLAERLRAWGAGEVRALDGIAALREILPPPGTPRPVPIADLVITDQALPGGSGLLAIELVRQRCGAVRAMVVTGDTSPGDLTLLEASGVPVLHKPFRTEALLATVQVAMVSTPLGDLP